ncbi:MAG: T9SS type A sorting domain-containing protein, partial [Saprospiraceae bacterium]|nr:T9SS type A sorting domain-containing protein [Saprospiraceae bacterium]
IQFTADETQSQTTNLVIHGEDIDNSPPFTGSSFNVSNRTTTSASATWNPSPWLNIGAAGTNEQTSDLSAVLQEVVDGSGWVENNSMSFIITGSGHRTADSYDGSSTNAPTLHITFTPALNPLPVELTKFQAVQQNAHVELFWKTASERNTDHFVIERSHNGYSFLEIESVTSQGDGVTIQNYNAKDIFPHNGMNYYRLKIVDNDSIFEYSNIQIVHLESPSAITLFPNPVNKTIQIEGLDENMKDGLIEIFDLEGKRIFVDRLPFEDGKLFISTAAINIYNPGTYFLRITGKIENHVFKFVKINGK